MYLAVGLGPRSEPGPSPEAPWCSLPSQWDPRGGTVASPHPPLAALPGPEVVEAWAAAATVPSGHVRQAGALAGRWVTGLADRARRTAAAGWGQEDGGQLKKDEAGSW